MDMAGGYGFASQDLFPQYDHDESQQMPTRGSMPQQYGGLWASQTLNPSMSFSSKDWDYPYDFMLQGTQDVNGTAQQPPVAPVPAIELGPHPNDDLVERTNVMSLVKPTEEAWCPPVLSFAKNQLAVHRPPTFARSNGVKTEPFLDYRTFSVAESDQTSARDSGYLSRTPNEPAIYKSTLYSDDISEISAISGSHKSSIATLRPQPGHFQSDSQVQSTTQRRRRSSHPLPVCKYCKVYQPKNQSDQLKHERRHLKPFKCKYAECKKIDVGFATSNDLDRHYKSGKHNQAPTKGALKGYVCAACTGSSIGKPKWWPRQDNFKAHCVRRHKNYDLDDLIKRSEHQNRPTHTYSDEERTSFSDPAYQQQSFPYDQDYSGGYDIAPPGQDSNLLTHVGMTDVITAPGMQHWDAQSWSM